MRLFTIPLLCIAIQAAFLPTKSAAAETSSSAIGETAFPLMAWDYVDNNKTLQDMADCGINCIAFIPAKMLDAVAQRGMKGIVFDERLADMWSKPFDGDHAVKILPAILNPIKDNPGFMGIHLKDEPGANEFAELGKAVAEVKKLAPGAWPYINLLPGGGADWDHYVKQFVDLCKPTAISYDRYSVVGKPGDFDPGFFTNLAQGREAAASSTLPLWNIVLTSPHWSYRDLTETDIRIQTWGSLVYGVRGIAYYKVYSGSLSILNAPDLGNFHDGPLDPFGEKTQTWHWLKNVDRQIQNMAPVLLKLKSDDVYHFGDIPDRNHATTGTDLVESLPAGQFVVGDFTHPDGSRYVMIVNKSMASPVNCLPKFRTPPKEIKYLSPITGEVKTFPVPYYWLSPGQGVLLKIEM